MIFKIIGAVVLILLLVVAWFIDQNNKPNQPAVQQQQFAPQPQPQQPRGADDMRNLKIP